MNKEVFLGRIGAITSNKKTKAEEKIAAIIDVVRDELGLLTTQRSPEHLDTDLMGQCPENIKLERYDVIKTMIGLCPHYCVVANIDNDYNIAWVIPMTTDSKIEIALPIRGSRIFHNYILPYFVPVFLNKNAYKFITVFDNKKEFDNMLKLTKNYTKLCILK